MSMSTRDARSEFTTHYGLIVHVVRRELAGPGQDERQDQAVCESWPIFARLVDAKPDVPARKLAAWAARRAAWRIRRALDARRARTARYLDALDVSSALADQLADMLAAERALSRFRGEPECPPTEQDRSDIESVIAQLPADVQPAVRLVSYGRSHRDVARTLDVSRAALARLLERAAALIVQRPGYEQRPDVVDDDDFPAARIRPVRAADDALPASCEPNRARRALDYPIAFPGCSPDRLIARRPLRNVQDRQTVFPGPPDATAWPALARFWAARPALGEIGARQWIDWHLRRPSPRICGRLLLEIMHPVASAGSRDPAGVFYDSPLASLGKLCANHWRKANFRRSGFSFAAKVSFLPFHPRSPSWDPNNWPRT